MAPAEPHPQRNAGEEAFDTVPRLLCRAEDRLASVAEMHSGVVCRPAQLAIELRNVKIVIDVVAHLDIVRIGGCCFSVIRKTRLQLSPATINTMCALQMRTRRLINNVLQFHGNASMFCWPDSARLFPEFCFVIFWWFTSNNAMIDLIPCLGVRKAFGEDVRAMLCHAVLLDVDTALMLHDIVQPHQVDRPSRRRQVSLPRSSRLFEHPVREEQQAAVLNRVAGVDDQIHVQQRIGIAHQP